MYFVLATMYISFHLFCEDTRVDIYTYISIPVCMYALHQLQYIPHEQQELFGKSDEMRATPRVTQKIVPKNYVLRISPKNIFPKILCPRKSSLITYYPKL